MAGIRVGQPWPARIRPARAWMVVLLLAVAAHSAAADLKSTPIHQLTQKERDTRIAGDLAAVETYRAGLRSVVAFAESRPDLFPAEKAAQGRTVSRDDRRAIRSAWSQFLDYLMALDSIGEYHRSFYRLRGEHRGQSFLAGYAAFLAQYRFALEFIERVENDPGLDVLLNEPVPELGVPGDSYARLKFRFLNLGRAAEFAAYDVIYKNTDNLQGTRIRDAIGEDRRKIWEAGKGSGEILTAKNALALVRRTGFKAYFPVQAGVSEWMGDTKVYRKSQSLISAKQIRALLPKLEPGDVLLERREWYLSNIGLPGFWPHAALYIGTAAERRRFFDDAKVREWLQSLGAVDGSLEAYLAAKYIDAYTRSLKPQESDHLPRVIEAISEGVTFTTLEHSADCDSLAVLRPRLSKRKKAEAILRAFQYAGRPYDFNFDFRTDATLVCTEGVYKAYEPAKGFGGLQLATIEMLGRPVLPANEIVRQFDEQFGTEKQQFDLVLFLDGDEKRRQAAEADVAAFRESWKRPKWHILVQDLDRE